MFEFGDKIGIVCCSNGQKCTYAEKITHLKNTLTKLGLQPVFSDYIYEKDDFLVAQQRNEQKHLWNFIRMMK